MENRFITDAPRFSPTRQRNGESRSALLDPVIGYSRGTSLAYARSFAAEDRVLVILIENGGVDLGIPALADKLLDLMPASSLLPDSIRAKLVDFLHDKIKSLTDSLLEGAELTLNRYTAAKPSLFSDVVVLRDGTASYNELKTELLSLSRAGKLVDLVILTHGADDYISVAGGIDGQKIRDLKTANGGPLSLRAVYMMNCVGSSLNQPWLDAGARASSGAIHNNYLPEPTTYFFWQNWKAGQGFETAVTSAYRKTVNLMNEAIRSFVRTLPVPGAALIANQISLDDADFVKDSAPVIQGNRAITINSDDLSSATSVASSFATTVLPVRLLSALSGAETAPGLTQRRVSAAGLAFIKQFAAFQSDLHQDAFGRCTIGYDTNLHPGPCDGRAVEQPYAAGITQAQADDLFAQGMSEVQQLVNDLVTVPLTDNQNTAIVSFVADVGSDIFEQSTMLALLNAGNYAAVPAELRKWTRVRRNGVVSEDLALTKRRNAEAALFEKTDAVPAKSAEQSIPPIVATSRYHSPGIGRGDLARQQNPVAAVVAGIEVADAVQIGLGAAAIVQAQVGSTQGSFTLAFDKAERLLTNDARQAMPGARTPKNKYQRLVLSLPQARAWTAYADIVAEWEGDAYGEIGTVMIHRDLANSSEFTKSEASITMTWVRQIPVDGVDPRAWPIVYSYQGTFNPLGNGYYEFDGEFEINAFGGIKFNKHEVFSRSFADWVPYSDPALRVQRGPDVIVPVPEIPAEQLAYLRSHLP